MRVVTPFDQGFANKYLARFFFIDTGVINSFTAFDSQAIEPRISIDAYPALLLLPVRLIVFVLVQVLQVTHRQLRVHHRYHVGVQTTGIDQ